MSQDSGGARRVLVAAQTIEELRWAVHQAAASNHDEWTVLCLGDAEDAPRTDVKATDRCKFVSVDDIGVDLAEVWRETQKQASLLWIMPSRLPAQMLHLAVQQYVFRALLRLVFQDAVISRAIKNSLPHEVRLPPIMFSRRAGRAAHAMAEMQLMVSEVALNQGIACRMPWLSRLKRRLGSVPMVATQLALLTYFGVYDFGRVLYWAASRIRTIWMPKSAAAPSAKAIILANADFELGRHFDLGRLSPELARRCLVWMFSPPLLVPFRNRLWRDQANANKRQRRREVAANFMGTPLAGVAGEAFPTLATPLILANSRVWYNSAWPTANPSPEGDLRAFRLFGSHVAAQERLMNWRRMAYAARYFAQACDLFRALRPSLVVTSDAHIGQRAVALAARHCGVRSLMTLQGVLMWREGYGDFYPLADATCLFADSYPLLAPMDYPGLPTKRIMCHDYDLEGPRDSRGARPAGRARPVRVLVVTSRYFQDGSESLLVRRKAYLDELRRLVETLAACSERLEIEFKPHPTNEPHEPYLAIQRDYPGAVKRVETEPLPFGAPIEADIVVFYNCTSTIFFYAFRQGIPIVAHWGALTTLARGMFATVQLAGSDDSARLARVIEEIVADPDGPAARESFDKARAVAGKFIHPSTGGINEALSCALGEKLQNA